MNSDGQLQEYNGANWNETNLAELIKEGSTSVSLNELKDIAFVDGIVYLDLFQITTVEQTEELISLYHSGIKCVDSTCGQFLNYNYNDCIGYKPYEGSGVGLSEIAGQKFPGRTLHIIFDSFGGDAILRKEFINPEINVVDLAYAADTWRVANVNSGLLRLRTSEGEFISYNDGTFGTFEYQPEFLFKPLSENEFNLCILHSLSNFISFNIENRTIINAERINKTDYVYTAEKDGITFTVTFDKQQSKVSVTTTES